MDTYDHLKHILTLQQIDRIIELWREDSDDDNDDTPKTRTYVESLNLYTFDLCIVLKEIDACLPNLFAIQRMES
jgi:hypothetical protein